MFPVLLKIEIRLISSIGVTLTEIDSLVSSTVTTTTITFGLDSKIESIVEVVNETIVTDSMKQIDVNKTFHFMDEFLFEDLPTWVGVSIVALMIYLILTACMCSGKIIALIILIILF